MIKLNIENQIRQQVAESIDIESESDELFKIVLPFTYSDGDQLLCFLENGDGGWFATDDGGAFSHAFDLGVNLDSENRIETVRNVASFYGADVLDGEVRLPVVEDNFAACLNRFSQAIFDISRVALSPASKQKRPANGFKDKLQKKVDTLKLNAEPKWHHPTLDPNNNYEVDYRIASANNDVLIFGINGTLRGYRSAATSHYYKQKELEFMSIAVYDDESSISEGVLSVLGDAVNRVIPISSPELIELVNAA